MSDESAELPRRRATSPQALIARQAATLVRDINTRLGVWHASSVKLQAMARRLKEVGASDPAVVEEAISLQLQVSDESRRFEEMLLSQPAAVAGHGRISDTRQSLQMILDRLTLSLADLGVTPGGGTRDEGRVDEVTRR